MTTGCTIHTYCCVYATDTWTEVVNENANQAFIDATGDKPPPGGRRVDTWSMCFQGGTFDRVKERCVASLSVAVRRVYAWVHHALYIAQHLVICRLGAYRTYQTMPPRWCTHAIRTARCSGDFPQFKMTKYTMGLPGLPDSVIAQKLPGNVTNEEEAIAAGPGMYGRMWLGQSLAFDEAYQILQDYI